MRVRSIASLTKQHLFCSEQHLVLASLHVERQKNEAALALNVVLCFTQVEILAGVAFVKTLLRYEAGIVLDVKSKLPREERPRYRAVAAVTVKRFC